MCELLASLCIASVLLSGTLEQPSYQEREFVEPLLIRATCYTSYGDNARTADGSVPEVGMLAGKREYLGKSAILYEVKEDGTIGDLIGYFEFCDTGGHKGLKNGTRIDVYRDTLSDCYDWIGRYGDYVYLQILDAK
ncbi:MAG: hypothetical protein Q4A15_06865 [Prevotellaceae bacterium]|nr:hypothetical protein [Prevotellaceae bacterium]